jgi:hypothetical protein
MNSHFLFSRRSRILEPSRPYSIHTLGSMSSAAAAADAPEEFGALAEYAVDDFMSEAASDVEVFATTEGHGDVSAEELFSPSHKSIRKIPPTRETRAKKTQKREGQRLAHVTTRAKRIVTWLPPSHSHIHIHTMAGTSRSPALTR